MYRVGKQRNRGNRTTQVREQTCTWVRRNSVTKDEGYAETWRKARNVWLVHARSRRQEKVLAPSDKV